MEEYSIRVKQLKVIKYQSYVKFIFAFLLINGLIIGLYFLGLSVYDLFEHIDFSENGGTEGKSASILYFAIAFVIEVILMSLFFLKLNKEYKESYFEVLFNECKLEEVYLLENKIKNDKETSHYISLLFNINKVTYKKAYSDASKKYSLDIDRLHYKKNKKKHIGTLFYVNFDNEKKGFLQLTRNENPPFNKYSGEVINKFGFNIKSKLHGYNMFSTYGSKSYFIEDKKFEKAFIDLEKFIQKRLNLVLDSNSLYIFIEDYMIYFVDGLMKPINNSIFDEKIQVIKRFHNLTFTLIEFLDDLFETKL